MMNKDRETTVITAPEKIAAGGLKVYLAGAIDMGNAVDWQSEVIRKLSGKSRLVLLNPRRPKFTPDTLDEQIEWELRALEEADYILMWFPADATAPISFLETGLYMTSGKLIIGAESGFFRRRNLQLTCERYGIQLWETLDQLIAVVLQIYQIRVPEPE